MILYARVTSSTRIRDSAEILSSENQEEEAYPTLLGVSTERKGAGGSWLGPSKNGATPK
jgi:hypothetical protein